MSIRAGALAPVALALVLCSEHALAQACCAGTSVVTPARLAAHESGLVGSELKLGAMTGSFGQNGVYQASPSSASELDFEQDLFAAARVLERGQLALFLPFIETHRRARTLSETGGGIGDVNLSARYDFTLAGESAIPGLAVLAGLTFPTGRPPDAPQLGPLVTGATGIGAWQGTLGLALEQSFGPWIVNASGLVAARTPRTVSTGAVTVHQRLAPEWTALGSVAYVLRSGLAFALSAAYRVEGNASVDDAEVAASGHRLTTLTASSVVPLSYRWRLQAAIFDNPQLSSFGENQPALLGGYATVMYAWP